MIILEPIIINTFLQEKEKMKIYNTCQVGKISAIGQIDRREIIHFHPPVKWCYVSGISALIRLCAGIQSAPWTVDAGLEMNK